jgi:putative restriction endonuclease
MQGMDIGPIVQYSRAFAELKRASGKNGARAPHKPVLLLTILAEIECGRLDQNRIELTEELISAFHLMWQALVTDPQWVPQIVMPFIRLASEGFWHLRQGNTELERTDLIQNEKSVVRTQLAIEYARFDPPLWQLMMNHAQRKILKQVLIDTYFAERREALAAVMNVVPVDSQIERLIELAATPFRRSIKPLEKSEDDMVYLRNRLFPKVIKNIYRAECAVCGIAVNDSRSNYVVLDAAHIMDYSVFHNDDPRNGIALCKNHHAGFDSGCFSISADYRLIVNAKARVPVDYAKQGAPIRMPEVHTCAPAQDALAWHRNHKLR